MHRHFKNSIWIFPLLASIGIILHNPKIANPFNKQEHTIKHRKEYIAKLKQALQDIIGITKKTKEFPVLENRIFQAKITGSLVRLVGLPPSKSIKLKGSVFQQIIQALKQPSPGYTTFISPKTNLLNHQRIENDIILNFNKNFLNNAQGHIGSIIQLHQILHSFSDFGVKTIQIQIEGKHVSHLDQYGQIQNITFSTYNIPLTFHVTQIPYLTGLFS